MKTTKTLKALFGLGIVITFSLICQCTYWLGWNNCELYNVERKIKITQQMQADQFKNEISDSLLEAHQQAAIDVIERNDSILQVQQSLVIKKYHENK